MFGAPLVHHLELNPEDLLPRIALVHVPGLAIEGAVRPIDAVTFTHCAGYHKCVRPGAVHVERRGRRRVRRRELLEPRRGWRGRRGRRGRRSMISQQWTARAPHSPQQLLTAPLFPAEQRGAKLTSSVPLAIGTTTAAAASLVVMVMVMYLLWTVMTRLWGVVLVVAGWRRGRRRGRRWPLLLVLVVRHFPSTPIALRIVQFASLQE